MDKGFQGKGCVRSSSYTHGLQYTVSLSHQFGFTFLIRFEFAYITLVGHLAPARSLHPQSLQDRHHLSIITCLNLCILT